MSILLMDRHKSRANLLDIAVVPGFTRIGKYYLYFPRGYWWDINVTVDDIYPINLLVSFDKKKWDHKAEYSSVNALIKGRYIPIYCKATTLANLSPGIEVITKQSFNIRAVQGGLRNWIKEKFI